MLLGVAHVLGAIFGATYPTNPALPAGDNSTLVNPTNWNTLIDNINAMGADLVDGRGDGQAFPGTDHTAAQAADLDDILQAIKHMLADIGGEANWYDDPGGSLKVHTHATGQGGAVPWSSIASNARFRQIFPKYPGEVETLSLRGAAASGSNTITRSSGEDVVSYVARHYHEATSSEVSLQDGYIAIRFTLPEEFTAWATANAIQIEYKTESGTSTNCHVDVYIYKSGTAAQVASSENNANTTWSTLTIDDSALGSWSAGDIMEIYLKLETRSDFYARVGGITLNFTS